MIDALFFVSIGLIAGLLSGLLGLGGGIIMVPGLYEWIHATGGPQKLAMQISVGTSLSAMMITALISGMTHHKVGQVRWELVRRIAPGMVVGALIGVQLIDIMPSASLKKIFSFFLFLIALQLLFFKMPQERHTPRFKPWLLSVSGVIIGTLAGMLGLGGGIFLMPMLIYNGLALTQCASTAIWCTLPTVTAGAFMAYWTGLNEPDLPRLSLGYVYWPATLGIGLTSLLSAPLGVYLGMRLPKVVLQKVFALVLCVIAIRLILH